MGTENSLEVNFLIWEIMGCKESYRFSLKNLPWQDPTIGFAKVSKESY